MIEIEAVEFRKSMKALSDVAYKQLPFATALALTNLAKGARDEVREKLPQSFTLRSNWLSKGITIESARKQDWPNPTAAVGSRDWFMTLHATGGVKRPRGKHLAQPAAARPNKQDRVPKSKWPTAFLRRKSGGRQPFINRLQSGQWAGHEAVLQRDSQKRYPLRVIWVFKPTVTIKKSWPFDEQVQSFVQRNYDKFFGQALGRAIKGARDAG